MHQMHPFSCGTASHPDYCHLQPTARPATIGLSHALAPGQVLLNGASFQATQTKKWNELLTCCLPLAPHLVQ
jgi:hypothetical protein